MVEVRSEEELSNRLMELSRQHSLGQFHHGELATQAIALSESWQQYQAGPWQASTGNSLLVAEKGKTNGRDSI